MKSASEILLRKQLYSLKKELPVIGVLGLPGIGKSESSKHMAKILERDRFSIDSILAQQLNKSTGLYPKEYMEKYGEELFRKWEKETLINNFKVSNDCILDFGGFGNFDIGYKDLFDKMNDKGIYTVFLNNDFGVTIGHLKKWNENAINPLTGQKGYHDWAMRPGYVAAALNGLKNGKSIDQGWIERHTKALTRIEFIYKYASHTLDLKNIDWTPENVAKMAIMETAENCIKNIEPYSDLFDKWKQEIAAQEKQLVGKLSNIKLPQVKEKNKPNLNIVLQHAAR